MINSGISLAMAPAGPDAPLTVPAAVDGEGFVEQLGDLHVAGSNGTTTVAGDVALLDVRVGVALRLYAPQPGNGRE